MMPSKCVGGVVLTVVLLAVTSFVGTSKYSWMKVDHFDEIDQLYRSVTEENCCSKSKQQMTMRSDVVSQLPVYNQLLSKIWYRNRTSLIHIHNMALNRAFFYSYVLQKMNTSETFSKQPNWLYFYFSAAADVNANPNTLNGSALYFDQHCHYPNWYTTVPFNKTLSLFGPKAYRWDDYRDQDNWQREPTRQVVQVVDFGAGNSRNYTHQKFNMNPWYNSWLPDLKGDVDSLTKFTYYVGIKASNVTGRFIKDTYDNYAFFGPTSPSASETDPRMLPVQFTAPYFDCGGSNKWVVSAVSPVVDFMPRYSNFTHLRRQRIVAVSVMDTDFVSLDFNACGVSAGNPGPSYLSGIHRCKPVTLCKHIIGYGFKRGGYTCACKSGQRYPWYVEQPYQGADIEVATEDEYKTDFSCTPTNYQQVLPVIDNLPGISVEGSGIVTSSGGQDTSVPKRAKRSPITKTSQTKIRASQTRTSQTKTRASQTRTSQLADVVYGETGENRSLTSALDQIKSQQWQHELGEEDHPRVVEELVEGHTVSEVMMIVDKLKTIRESKLQDRVLGFKVNSTAYSRIDHHNEEEESRTLVDVHVETMYQKDLQRHRALKNKLMETKNMTRSTSLLHENIRMIRDRHIQRYHASKTGVASKRGKRALVFDDQSFDRMMRILRKKASVTSSNCRQLPNHQLYLPGDVGYGVWTQFESEGRTALRLSHFLSMFLQNVMPEENFGDLKGGGRLTEDHLFGEVLANVMGNFKILSAGVFFDRYKFVHVDGSRRELFGPWAFRKSGSFYAMDTAGLPSHYVDTDWFTKVKARFAANFQNVRLYKIRAHIRSDPNGTSSVRHEYYPMTYRAATYELGFWTSPHFRCDGNVDAWVMTYVSPFFGLNPLRNKLEFRGVTTVDVALNLLEINQCAQTYTVANAFKNTARCDYFSTTAGFPFLRGSYRCLCKLGFEYWHADGKFWIEGSLLELEYEKKKAGLFSRFDLLTCRVSAAGRAETSLAGLVVVIITGVIFTTIS